MLKLAHNEMCSTCSVVPAAVLSDADIFSGPPAQAQTLHVPWGTIGTMDKSFGIVWSQGNKKVICNCNKTTSTYEKIVYYC